MILMLLPALWSSMVLIVRDSAAKMFLVETVGTNNTAKMFLVEGRNSAG